jgi:hypothetical protein
VEEVNLRIARYDEQYDESMRQNALDLALVSGAMSG